MIIQTSGFNLKLVFLTLITLTAFAGNSVLCRLALTDNTIDPGSFTVLRLLSGALSLALIVKIKNKVLWKTVMSGSWRGAAYLFAYATCFSYAYLSLDAGIGALVLFGCVQITMFLTSIWAGQRTTIREFIGLLIAFSGLVVLLMPKHQESSSLLGFALMAIAGVAWGQYTLLGKQARQPLIETTFNFMRTLPLCVLLVFFIDFTQINLTGVLLALASGSITSGLGYAMWFLLVPQLSITQAAVSQLTVPVITTIGGTMFISEPISLSLVLASLLTLGGVWFAMQTKH